MTFYSRFDSAVDRVEAAVFYALRHPFEVLFFAVLIAVAVLA